MQIKSSGAITLSLALSGLLAGCASPGTPRAATPVPVQREWQVYRDLQVTVLRPGVWLHTSWHTDQDGARVSSNGLIVEEQQHLVLIDTAWGEVPTQALLAWIARELRRPVRRAIITHAHEDRMGGAQILLQQGIPSVAHPLTVRLAMQRRWPAPDGLGNFAPGERLRLGSVVLFNPGPAHSPDNIMVWIPSEQVLFGGCAVRAATTTSLGNVADADLAGWREAMRRTQRHYRGANVVVPGHGEAGGPELLEHTRQLLPGGAK